MQFGTILLAAPLLLTACSAAAVETRATLDDINLYAYAGANFSGDTVKYGKSDGLAYITTSNSTELSQEYLALTWDISQRASVPWNITTSNGTTSTFYITGEGYNPAGFLNSTSNSTTADVSGFRLYGTQVFFKNGSSLQSAFWAEATGEDDVWALKWNADGTTPDNSVPVTLKTTAPDT